jgi:hypothetical protein
MKTQLYGRDILTDGEGLHYDAARVYRNYFNELSSPAARFVFNARVDFKNNRLNGDEKRDACAPWIERAPDETSITWVKGEKRSNGHVYRKVESDDGSFHIECRYDADSADLEWMRKTDCNYLKRILKEGQLKALESNVYYLCLISATRCIGDEIAKGFDIGAWWRTQVDKPNIADLLQSAQTVYEARRVLEAKCEMLPDLSKIIGEYVTVASDKKEEKDVAVDPKPSSSAKMKM